MVCSACAFACTCAVRFDELLFVRYVFGTIRDCRYAAAGFAGIQGRPVRRHHDRIYQRDRLRGHVQRCLLLLSLWYTGTQRTHPSTYVYVCEFRSEWHDHDQVTTHDGRPAGACRVAPSAPFLLREALPATAGLKNRSGLAYAAALMASRTTYLVERGYTTTHFT